METPMADPPRPSRTTKKPDPAIITRMTPIPRDYVRSPVARPILSGKPAPKDETPKS